MEYGVCYDSVSGNVFFDDINLVLFKLPEVADIYYGVSSSIIINENYIKLNFAQESGFVGNSSTGRTYIFESGYTFKFWCIKDIPNDGVRVMNTVTVEDINTVLAYDYYYHYYQIDPTPSTSITYGKITIDGYVYRIYRTKTKTSSNSEIVITSF